MALTQTARPNQTIAAAPRPRGAAGEKFASAEQAWFWTMAALAARRAGGGGGRKGVSRPCEPDDVLKCLDELYRHRRIDLAHARILRRWGERQAAPDPRYPAERGEAQLWQEALARLEWKLRMKGIVI